MSMFADERNCNEVTGVAREEESEVRFHACVHSSAGRCSHARVPPHREGGDRSGEGVRGHAKEEVRVWGTVTSGHAETRSRSVSCSSVCSLHLTLGGGHFVPVALFSCLKIHVFKSWQQVWRLSPQCIAVRATSGQTRCRLAC